MSIRRGLLVPMVLAVSVALSGCAIGTVTGGATFTGENEVGSAAKGRIAVSSRVAPDLTWRATGVFADTAHGVTIPFSATSADFPDLDSLFVRAAPGTNEQCVAFAGTYSRATGLESRSGNIMGVIQTYLPVRGGATVTKMYVWAGPDLDPQHGLTYLDAHEWIVYVDAGRLSIPAGYGDAACNSWVSP